MKDIDEIRRDNMRLIELERGGPSEAAKAIGMSLSQFTNLRDGAKDSQTGRPRGMRKETARRIEVAAEKPEGWLDTDHSAESAPRSPAAAPHATGDEFVIVQYDVSGGMDTRGKLILDGEVAGEIKSWRVNREWLRMHVPVYTSLQNLCIVTGFGPSMKPMFNPGDPLLVDRGVKLVDHEGVYFFRIGDQGFIKIIQRVPNFDKPGFALRIISKNKEDFPPYDISPTNPDFHVIGKILTVWKSEQY
ncbi:S24 family peptidase [Variovorax paradoxus]|uniref:S24 family peptidase n=1 Tax=Variovorax paradoxus TaxID=34073 RepID=UPI002859D417|nr:S24 family peptidase [Variovorax paradoxus]MDR6453921.1 phage repressor protein C with HTH and peptisase S24 domain [Variovorax paradoxus]